MDDTTSGPTRQHFAEILVEHLEYVRRLRAMRDPWELSVALEVDRLLDHGVGARAFARKFYPQFIALVARELPADVDALLATAKSLFGVNVSTMRAHFRIARTRGETV